MGIIIFPRLQAHVLKIWLGKKRWMGQIWTYPMTQWSAFLCLLMCWYFFNPVSVTVAPSHCTPCTWEFCCPCGRFTSTFSVRAGVLVGYKVGSVGLQNMQRWVIWISVTRNRFILNAYTNGLSAEFTWDMKMPIYMANLGMEHSGQKKVMQFMMCIGSQHTAKRKTTKASDLANFSSFR